MSTDKYRYDAIVAGVHDADSFRADVDFGFGIWAHDIPFRLYGVNAPELNTEEGKIAHRFLVDLMPIGTRIEIETIKDKREKYGRMLAKVRVGERDAAAELLAAGYAKFYDGHGPR